MLLISFKDQLKNRAIAFGVVLTAVYTYLSIILRFASSSLNTRALVFIFRGTHFSTGAQIPKRQRHLHCATLPAQAFRIPLLPTWP